ncbi:unnamed protein product [Pieris macdunnoughi]|uniref:Uncharacterized protein n=1 Tax=Pieris macdunnoughi TaxID=345717 RepID=A0A821V574_9NEOP|nr:unnamed protein product [Pieris macdunnoughi]
MPNKNFNVPKQYPNQSYNQHSMQNQSMPQQNMAQYPVMQQFNQNMQMQGPQPQMPYMANYPQNYMNQSGQMHPMQMSRSSVMSVDNSGNMPRGTINSYYENQCPQNLQHTQNVQYHQPPYNTAPNLMGPPPPKNNQFNNQYYNRQLNQWEYANQYNKMKSAQNSVNMSTGSQKPVNSMPPINQALKNGDTDCSMNSLRSQNQPSDVQVWDISQSQIDASNNRKKQNSMRQDTYQRTLEYVENCENWKSSEMVSSSTHPLQGGDNMVVNDLQTSLSSFYEENQYLQMIQ